MSIMSNNSVDNSQPIEFFHFTGTYRSYHYTSDYLPHISMGEVCEPLPGLVRSAIKVGTHEDDREEMKVEVPVSAQVVKDYAFQTTPPRLNLKIIREQRDGSSSVTIWDSKVTAISSSEHMATFKSPSQFSTMLSDEVPTVYIQSQCNHILYDSMCKAPRENYIHSAVVASIHGIREVRLDSAGSFPENWFRRGEFLVPLTGEYRTIVKVEGDIVTLSYQMSLLEVGMEIEMTAGCDHIWNSPDGCVKFENQVNFGGFPFVPGDHNNLFQSGIRLNG